MKEIEIAEKIAEKLMGEFEIYNYCDNCDRERATKEEIAYVLLKEFKKFEIDVS